jgi:hypothetical protein
MRLKYAVLLSLVVLSGCASMQQHADYEDVYRDRQACNGDMEISHSITISTNDKGVEQAPKVTAICNPKVYDPQTDFEKENRRPQTDR